MNETITLLLSLLAGILLGLFFFVGLWWTLQKGLNSPRIALWLSTSMFLRTTLVLIGFYYVGHTSWKRMLACLLGFFIARLITVRRTQRPSL